MEQFQAHLPPEPPFSPESRLRLRVHFTFNDRRRRDLDNCLKSLLDASNGRLFHDDCQIYHLEAAKGEGPSMLIHLYLELLTPP